jgi:putative sugar O-methyltransferase
MRKMIRYIKLITPPVIIYILQGLPIFSFKRFFNKVKNNKKINAKLIEITEKFINSDSYNHVSKYWHYLNIQNFKQIILQEGIENYSTSIAKNYYTFLFTTENQITNTLKNVELDTIEIKTQLFKKHKNLSYYESFFYNFLLILLYKNLEKTSSFKILEKLSDIGYLGFGDPYLNINNINITHDKINSCLDYDNIKKIKNFNNFKKILEIGAGSGRTSEAIITLNEKINYTICDIPPAIYISYNRLKKAFPAKRINLLFDIKDSEVLMNEIKKNDISFIFPHQLKLIKEKFFELSLAIDCIHEMDKKTINYYFDNVNNFSNYFYFSIWEKTLVPFSFTFLTKLGNRLDFYKNDYPIKKNWTVIFKKNSIFPGNFINLCFKIDSVKL